jgi:ferrous iron transport protein A
MNDRPPVPLEQLAPGAHAIVREIRGGADFSGRLAAMGLAKGARVEILQNRGHGPVLVRAHETRIALGRGEALKILVEETSDGPSA